MRNVAFYSNKKTGYKLCESGIADVILDGRGMAVTTHLVSADKDRSSVFKVKDVHIKVHSLKLRVRDTRYDAFYNAMRSFLAPIVKSHMEKVVAQAIRTGVGYLDGKLVTARDRMEETKTKEKLNSPEVFHDSASMKTSESKSRFKVVRNGRASMVQVTHPAGWVEATREGRNTKFDIRRR